MRSPLPTEARPPRRSVSGGRRRSGRSQTHRAGREEEPVDLDVRMDERRRAAGFPGAVGFMRSKTQERIEAFAAERAAACRTEASGEGRATIDLALVEEGIEIGKKMMAEMIATYNAPRRRPPSLRLRRRRLMGSPAKRLSERGEVPLTPKLQLPSPKSAGEVQSLCIGPDTLGVGPLGVGSYLRELLPLLSDRRYRPARRRDESLLGAVLSRRAADVAESVQALDPRPSSLVQQLHGRLRGPEATASPVCASNISTGSRS